MVSSVGKCQETKLMQFWFQNILSIGPFHVSWTEILKVDQSQVLMKLFQMKDMYEIRLS